MGRHLTGMEWSLESDQTANYHVNRSNFLGYNRPLGDRGTGGGMENVSDHGNSMADGGRNSSK